MQNINLHRAQFPLKTTVKVSNKYSLIIIIICVSLVVGASLAYWKIKVLKEEYIAFTKSSSMTQSAIDSIRSDLSESAREDNLKIDLLNIKDKLKHKQALKDTLDEESTDATVSFYHRFIALSKRDIGGIWLTKIVFSDKGRKLTLGGDARSADLIGKYIDILSKEALFSGLTFESLMIINPEKKNDGIIRFIISSELIEMTTPLQEALNGFENGE